MGQARPGPDLHQAAWRQGSRLHGAGRAQTGPLHGRRFLCCAAQVSFERVTRREEPTLIFISNAPSTPPAITARRSIADQLKYAIVWGTSAKHNRGQKVGLAHELQDEDGESACLFGLACRGKELALLIRLVCPDLQSFNSSSGSKSLVLWYILQLLLLWSFRGSSVSRLVPILHQAPAPFRALHHARPTLQSVVRSKGSGSHERSPAQAKNVENKSVNLQDVRVTKADLFAANPDQRSAE